MDILVLFSVIIPLNFWLSPMIMTEDMKPTPVLPLAGSWLAGAI